MPWDFETDPQFQEELNWIDDFVTHQVEPIDQVLEHPYDIQHPGFEKLVRPLQKAVQDRKLWACHLGANLGGPGYGQLKLALMNEILGRSRFAPIVFGTQAPDSGNGEILAHYGGDELKQRFLEPLLRNEIVSCYSMTEPHAGADPKMFTCRAELDGDEWVINGHKWFSSNARWASFLVAMVVTNPEAPPYNRLSMIVVPRDTPGLNIIRDVAVGVGERNGEGSHGYIHYDNVRVPRENLLGGEGQGFVVAQTRLGGGRIHHAMRTLGQIKRAFDAMCQRVLSRETQGEILASKQLVQEKIADSWIEMEQFRLFVLRTAWRIDRYQDYRRVRKDIAAVKAAMPKVYHDVVTRAIQLHGSLGISNEMPFVGQLVGSITMGIADGPTEVHKITVARQILREYEPYEGLFPPLHYQARRADAVEKLGSRIEHEVGSEYGTGWL